MQLPTQAQVNTAGRYAGAVLGTAFAIFGLQAKGVSLDQAKAAVAAFGTVVNDVVVLVGIVAPVYVSIKGIISSSKTGQAAAIGANGSTIVNANPDGTATVKLNDPAMASAALTAQKNAA